MQHTISHIYNNYVETNIDISKQLFVDICSEFNMMIIDYILDGKEFNMGYNLSTLSVVRMERDPRNPGIDWGESNKYKAELLANGDELFDKDTGDGVKWHIYYTTASILSTTGVKVSVK